MTERVNIFTGRPISDEDWELIEAGFAIIDEAVFDLVVADVASERPEALHDQPATPQ